MSSYFGKVLHLQIFGESHGPAIGMTLDGLPAGMPVDEANLAAFMARRAPGQQAWVTQRKEQDRLLFLSGLKDGKTAGTPLTAIIQNNDVRRSDYKELKNTYRPGHAEFTAHAKWGENVDLSGGGHFSGRLTAPLCIAGGLAKQMLTRQGIHIGACLRCLGPITSHGFDPIRVTKADLQDATQYPMPLLDSQARQEAADYLRTLQKKGDAVGGEIEVAAIGIPAGLGAPIFEGLENRLAQAFFAIPGLRGIAFGEGFHATTMCSSEHNDPYDTVDGKILPLSNHAGGILGGISTGLPLIIHLAMKPTPSIARPQKSVDRYTGEKKILEIHGRHDPAICIRAVPVAEAVAAIVLLDQWLTERSAYDFR